MYATTLPVFKPDTVYSGKVNVRDQNQGGLQSLCSKTESKAVFSEVFFFAVAVI